MTAVPTGGYFFSSALWQQDCGPEMDKARGRCALAARVVSVVAITGALAGAAAIFYGTTIAIISGCALNFFGALSGCSLCISGFLALYSFGEAFFAARDYRHLTHDHLLLSRLCDPAERTCTKEEAITSLIKEVNAPLFKALFERRIRAYLNRILV